MKTLLILLSAFIFFNSYGQAPDILWEHGYGGNVDDRAYNIIQTDDGGYLVVGYSDSDDGDLTENFGITDFWVTKLNNAGELEWQKSYGGSSLDMCNSICKGIDGGYILAGVTGSTDGDITSTHGGSEAWLIKIDDSGNIEWQKCYGGTYNEGAQDIIKTSDNFYLVTCYSGSDDGDVNDHKGEIYSSDFWLLKLDLEGNIIWSHCYGSTEVDFPNTIVEVADGYVAAGYTLGYDGDVSFNYGSVDSWIIKLDTSGDLDWQSSFGGSQEDEIHEIVVRENGDLMLGGYTLSDDWDVTYNHGAYDCWIISIDSLGNLKWEKTYGSSGFDEIYSIIEYSENEFIFAGRTSSTDGDVAGGTNGANDYWIGAIDTMGSLIWETTVGGSLEDLAISIVKGTDGNLITAGFSASNDFDVTSTYDLANSWIVKLGWCTNEYYADADGDGYGDLLMDSTACEIPLGYVIDSTDCNDSNSSIHPFLEDICNALDDNCNGELDEDAIFTTYYADVDADSYGDAENDSLSCTLLSGYVIDSTDCNDANETVHPGAKEICDYLDNDCDGFVDDNVSYILSYLDADGDNYGTTVNDTLACEIPEGYVTEIDDCDDTNEDIYPGAPETFNGVDDNCDGKIDEGLALVEMSNEIITIHPNPATAFINISSSLDNYSNTTVTIYTVAGVKVVATELTCTLQEIDVTEFPQGLYTMIISNGNEYLYWDKLIIFK